MKVVFSLALQPMSPQAGLPGDREERFLEAGD